MLEKILLTPEMRTKDKVCDVGKEVFMLVALLKGFCDDACLVFLIIGILAKHVETEIGYELSSSNMLCTDYLKNCYGRQKSDHASLYVTEEIYFCLFNFGYRSVKYKFLS